MTGIIILNYNNYEDTINCIESVCKYNTSKVKFIVVDNGSSDKNVVDELDIYLEGKFSDSYTKVRDESPQLTTIPSAVLCVSDKNDGYARGNNKGLKIAFSDNTITDILILNNDVLFTSDIIPILRHHLYLNTNTAVISPLLYKRNGIDLDYNCARKNIKNNELILEYLLLDQNIWRIKEKLKGKRLLLKQQPELMKLDSFEIELPSGSCMLVKKDVFESIGGFDSGTFLFYEENILFKKFQDLGLKSYLVPSVSCIHLGGESRSKVPSKFVINKEAESALYYAKYFGDFNRIQLLLFSITIRFFKFLLKLAR